MSYFYDPLKKSYKSQIGAIACGSLLTLNVYETKGGEDSFSADSCTLLLWRDCQSCERIPMRRCGERFSVSLRIHQPGLYFYRFQVGERILSAGKLRRAAYGESPADWQITAYETTADAPEWLMGGVIYQIFPDRFCKEGECPLSSDKVKREWGDTPNFRANEHGEILNNDFFGGNLKGIESKLGYLKDLGVTAIYLNPVFEAYSNHRYDTGDYFKIDETLGTMGDFESLVEAAKEHGIRLILDGVFNHTGADSVYFNRYGHYPSIGAYQSQASPYFDWFHFISYPNQYESWWGVKTLPAVNEASKSYQEFILGEHGVLNFWLKKGIGGFRLDVADELPDFFLKKLHRTVKDESPDAVIIGEVWEDASNKIAYKVRREYFQGEELDSVMNYPLKDAIIDFMLSGKTDRIREILAELIDNYPPSALNLLMNSLGTHDTQRILTVLGQKKCFDKEDMAKTFLSDNEKLQAIKLLKQAALLQYTLPGVPCVYYGDENGMEGYQDPFCRRCFDWEHLNEDLISYYQALGKLRFEYRALFAKGIYREVFSDSGCLVYERRNLEKNTSIYCFVNRSESKYKIHFEGKRFKDYLSDKLYQNAIDVDAHSSGILIPVDCYV